MALTLIVITNQIKYIRINKRNALVAKGLLMGIMQFRFNLTKNCNKDVTRDMTISNPVINNNKSLYKKRLYAS